MGGTDAFRFNPADSFRRDVASEIFQACDVTEVNDLDFRIAMGFPGISVLCRPVSPLHDREMKQLMNAAEAFSPFSENVRK
jgi:hypothetical protein